MLEISRPYITWRRAVGPIATIVSGCAILLVNRYVTGAPIAAPMFLWAIVLSAYCGGLASGLVSAGIALGFGAAYFWAPGPLHPSIDLARFVVLAVAGPAIAVTVGLLHAREQRALETERAARANAEAANRELLVLRAALEQVDYGVVLLDQELRAQFINRAFRKIWNLPDDKADSKPAFVALMYHGRDTQAYAVPPQELDRYVAQRTALVRRGDEVPVDLRLSNGEVLRFKCKTLPNGGRMLSYATVTDLVHQAEELQTLAATDPLTGVYNRRHFFVLAEAEWARFERYGRPLSMLMIDIDHFKSINDRFGHGVGDEVIAGLADVCRRTKRHMDILARVGGEEFAILLPETDAGEAVRFAERVREELAAACVRNAARLSPVTISVGVAQAGAEASSITQLMKMSDSALYAAKHQGRDRVVLVDGADQGRQVA